jgi:hypothetical protein
MGGWAEGLMAAGFRCIGFDVKNWGYPGRLVLADVRTLDGRRFRGRASLVVASPPCQEFSYRSLPFRQCQYLRDNVPPDKSIWEACVRIAREAELPLVLENVRGAERYMGKAAARFGSYYLWGDVPALLPPGKPTKGFYAVKDPGNPRALHRASAGARMAQQRPAAAQKWDFAMPNRRQSFSRDKSSPWAERRRLWSAQVAKVPFELGHWIGSCYLPGGSAGDTPEKNFADRTPPISETNPTTARSQENSTAKVEY